MHRGEHRQRREAPPDSRRGNATHSAAATEGARSFLPWRLPHHPAAAGLPQRRRQRPQPHRHPQPAAEPADRHPPTPQSGPGWPHRREPQQHQQRRDPRAPALAPYSRMRTKNPTKSLMTTTQHREEQPAPLPGAPNVVRTSTDTGSVTHPQFVRCGRVGSTGDANAEILPRFRPRKRVTPYVLLICIYVDEHPSYKVSALVSLYSDSNNQSLNNF